MNSKLTKLETARHHVEEVSRLAEEIEDDCDEPYCENGFDSDFSPPSLCEPYMLDFECWTADSK
eukprot:2269795-Prorocentrum_lima.AAC.1